MNRFDGMTLMGTWGRHTPIVLRIRFGEYDAKGGDVRDLGEEGEPRDPPGFRGCGLFAFRTLFYDFSASLVTGGHIESGTEFLT
jgi:hypothetical protein